MAYRIKVPFHSILPFLGAMTFLLSCNTQPRPENHFSDESILKIAELQDRRDAKGLVHFIKAKKPIHRMAAVKALGSVQDTSVLRYLNISMLTDQDERVREIAAYAMGQYRDSSLADKLLKALELELDPAIQNEILLSMGKCSNLKTAEILGNFAQKPILSRGHAAAMFHCTRRKLVHPKFAQQCLTYLNNQDATMETKMYAAFTLSSLGIEMGDTLCEKIKAIRSQVEDHDVQVALDRCCAEPENTVDTTTYIINEIVNKPYVLAKMIRRDLKSRGDLLKDYILNSEHQIVRTTAAELYFNHQLRPLQDTAVQRIVKLCLESRDMALQSLASNYLLEVADTTMAKKYLWQIDQQINLLALPRQMETYIDFLKLKAKLTGSKFTQPTIAFNHPINWEVVKQIPKNQKVLLKTSKGVMVIQLYVEEAPGSVWNFLETVKSGKYNGRYFHRVVPNFVIQGGCPRGDGWGSPDWTQRSEFSNKLRYKRGSVGLASVGNDTEGVQFFITHCATPHLNGRYTIFGEVTEGFDVIDLIEVGDIIEEIILL